jgi:hypothetical protein
VPSRIVEQLGAEIDVKVDADSTVIEAMRRRTPGRR